MNTSASAMSVILLSALASALGQPAGPTVAPGQSAPEFAVHDLDGKSWKRAELQQETAPGNSGPLVLTFWCTFCHSCREIDRKIEKLAAEYKGKAAIFALDSSAGETAEKITAFTKTKGLKVPVLLDPGAKVADLFGAKVTTTTLIIDGKGVLRYRGQFAHGQHAFAEEALKAVLAGKDVTVPSTKEFG